MRYTKSLNRFENKEENFFDEFMMPVPVDKDRFFNISQFDFSVEDNIENMINIKCCFCCSASKVIVVSVLKFSEGNYIRFILQIRYDIEMRCKQRENEY